MITPENLLSLGFVEYSSKVNGFLGQNFRMDVYDTDMLDDEYIQIILERGNGYDPDCWTAIFIRYGQGYPTPATLRHGLEKMDEVKTILSIFVNKEESR